MSDNLFTRLRRALNPDAPIEIKNGQLLKVKDTTGIIDLNRLVAMLNAQEDDGDDYEERLGVQDAWAQSTAVNIGTDKIAAAAARVPLKFYDKANNEVPAPSAFVGPYTVYTTEQLIYSLIAWDVLRGEYFLVPRWRGDEFGRPKDAQQYRTPPDWFLAPDPKEFKNTPAANAPIKWWHWSPSWGAEEFLPFQLFHYHVWTPYSMYRGQNPLIAILPLIKEDILASEANHGLLVNNGEPSGVLSTDTPLSPEEAETLAKQWKKAHSRKKRGGIAVLGSGTGYQQTSMTPKDMEFHELRQWIRSTITGRLGVPPAVSGYKDPNTPLSGSDTEEQIQQFWHVTVIPKDEALEEFINNKILAIWWPNLHCSFDYSEIHELQADQEKIDNGLRLDVENGMITINEVREMRDQSPLPWGDTWWKKKMIEDVEEVGGIPAAPTPTAQITTDNELPEPGDAEKASLWWMTYKDLNPIVLETKKTIHEWLFAQRAELLSKGVNTLSNGFVAKHKLEIKNKMGETLKKLDPIIRASLSDDYARLGITRPVYVEDTALKAEAEEQIANVVDVIVKQIHSDATATSIKNLYKAAAAKSNDAAETLIYQYVNKNRMMGFKQNAISHHQIVEPRDEPIDFFDGEVAEVGSLFSNGKPVPPKRALTIALEKK
jgi:phage portal protein BeeE